jgi:hypothetical protein
MSDLLSDDALAWAVPRELASVTMQDVVDW